MTEKEKTGASTSIKTEKTTPEPTPAAQKRFIYNDAEISFKLEYPITIGNGEQVIDRITLRKPSTGELRGLSMFEVMHLDTDSLLKLLPRITTPSLHSPIANQLDLCDLATIGKCISGFFSGKKERAELMSAMAEAAKE